MRNSNPVSNLIPIDENMTLQDIMGNNHQMNQQMGMENLYNQLAESVQTVAQSREKKPTKKRAKKNTTNPVMIPQTAVHPNPTQAPITPAVAKKKAAINDKESLIMKIQKYQSSRRFGQIITKELKISQSREQLIKLSIDRLENILHRIRLHLNNRNLDSIFENMAVTCAKGYEASITPFYNIEGFSELLLNNPGFWDAFERWKIEREMPNIPPGIQLAYIIASTTITAHTLNTARIPQPKEKIIIDNDKKQDKDSEKPVRSNFQLGDSI